MLKFRLGQIVATPGALDALLMAGQTPAVFLRCHVIGESATARLAESFPLGLTSIIRICFMGETFS